MGGKAQMGQRETDLLLVQRAQQGDERAFEALVRKYQRKVARLLSRFFRDEAEIEDVAQEAFIKAYRALPSFRGDSAFYTWLFRIAVNTAKNHLQSAQRRLQESSISLSANEDEEGGNHEDLLADISTPENELISSQIAQIITNAIESLPSDLRMAITLREFEGLSYDEIAEIMDCPIGTVRSRIFRAREVIAERIRPLIETDKRKRW
jgi:RNA polymerase sigma-70 factor (ECF subfamily)